MNLMNKLKKKVESLTEEKQNLSQQNRVKPSQDKQERLIEIDSELSKLPIETYDKEKNKI